MFSKNNDKASPRQLRHIDFVSQFTNDIRHVNGRENIVADTLSRANVAATRLTQTIDYTELEQLQKDDPELQQLLRNNTTALTLMNARLMEDLQCGAMLLSRPFVLLFQNLYVEEYSRPCTIWLIQVAELRNGSFVNGSSGQT
jgi:hypothetical protein